MTGEEAYPGGFLPGDAVEVVEGTFAGYSGRVLGFDEVRDFKRRGDGEPCVYEVLPGCVWVLLVVLGCKMPVMLLPSQIRRAQKG